MHVLYGCMSVSCPLWRRISALLKGACMEVSLCCSLPVHVSLLCSASVLVYAVLCGCARPCCAQWVCASMPCSARAHVYAVFCGCVSMLRCVAVRVPLLCKAGACVYAVLCWGASFSAVLHGCASVVFCGCPCRCCPLQASVYATLYVCVSCMLCSV